MNKAEDNVHTGFWINWENGRTRGATITLPTYHGLVLNSFLTLYVQFTGICFWRVVCFILHQLRSDANPRDGLFHQQQTILRNGITAPYTLWSLACSAFAWKGKVNAVLRNTSPLLLVSTLHIAFFAIAGLFSSLVTKTTAGQALVRSHVCGFPNEISDIRNTESLDLDANSLLTFNTEALMGRITLSKSSAYVRTCYNDTSNAGTAACKIYVRPHLIGETASAVYNATCPFGNGACATDAARYDSGHLRSGEDMGINIRNQEGLSMRRVTTCAPILGEEKYATEWRDDKPETMVRQSNTSVKYYEFGNSTRGCEATSDTTDLTTFCVSQYQKDNLQAAYTVRAKTFYPSNQNASDFTPIPDFSLPNADTTLISILSTAKYAGQVTDPLFLATNRIPTSKQFYNSTHDLNILACTEQYQLCNRANSRCTNLTGLYTLQHEIDNGDLALNPLQTAAKDLIWKSAWAMGLQWAVEVLSSDVLLARDSVFTAKSQTSSALPSHQWHLESYNLHNLSLAVFQRRINEFAKPEDFQIRDNVNSLSQIREPDTPEMRQLCSMLKIRSADHYSISVLGMAIILGVGGFLIALDWFLIEPIFWFRSFSRKRQFKKTEWTNTGTLQLYKQALEARGVGPWETKKDFEFPVLKTRYVSFAGLGVQGGSDVELRKMGVQGRGWEDVGTPRSGTPVTEYRGNQFEGLPVRREGLRDEVEVLMDGKGVAR